MGKTVRPNFNKISLKTINNRDSSLLVLVGFPIYLKDKKTGIPIVAQQVKKLTDIHEDVGLLPGLRIQCYCKLWCKLQMRLRSGEQVFWWL